MSQKKLPTFGHVATIQQECAKQGPIATNCFYGVADKSLARPGRKQATATEDFDVHIAYL